jgi:hypothetical protein
MLVIDNVISEEDRNDLVYSKSFKTVPDYNWWDGWWNCPPRNAVEYALYLLWQPYLGNGESIAGIEYWSRKSTGRSDGLGWHQDTDESVYETDQYNIADGSLVYYPIAEDVEGGMFCVLPYEERGSLQNVLNYIQMYEDSTGKEKIRCVQNRAIIYNSARIHKISTVFSGVRENLASSFWFNKPEIFKQHENYNTNKFKPIEWKDKHEKNKYKP